MWFWNKKEKCEHQYKLIKSGDLTNEIPIEQIKSLIKATIYIPEKSWSEVYFGTGVPQKPTLIYTPEQLKNLISEIKTSLTHIIGYYEIYKCEKCNHIEITKVYFK